MRCKSTTVSKSHHASWASQTIFCSMFMRFCLGLKVVLDWFSFHLSCLFGLGCLSFLSVARRKIYPSPSTKCSKNWGKNIAPAFLGGKTDGEPKNTRFLTSREVCKFKDKMKLPSPPTEKNKSCLEWSTWNGSVSKLLTKIIYVQPVKTKLWIFSDIMLVCPINGNRIKRHYIIRDILFEFCSAAAWGPVK